MATNYNSQLKRRMGGPERVLLLMPLNVVMVAKIRGTVDVEQLASVLDSLRKRHALLAVRVVIDENNIAWYVSEGVSEFTINTIPRQAEDQWLQTTVEECKTSFPIETGPLIRFSLLHSPEKSDLVICAHHAICDGVSLTCLIRDILRQLAEPEREVEILPEPAAITRDTIPSPPPSNFIARGVIGLFNKLWTRQNIRFDSNDLKRLHRVFWEKNQNVGVLAWESSIAETKALVSRCKAENVTVNTALWTAFLTAQYQVQGDAEPYRTSAGLAVSTRDKLTVLVGEALGFYASSLTTQLEYDPSRTFWDTARIFHQKIGDSLAKTNIFRSLSAELLAPTLLDSLYFSKYGLIKSRLSDKLLQQMNWRGISYGYAITNVGRMNIPTSYDQYQLESVYGPFVYSDVNEKTIGIITVGDKVTFLMSYNETIVTPQTAEKIRETAMDYLSNGVN
ncbi:MAG: condensation domain-containing protein [Chloroflexales bacterium]|nr:condensation domain-containing protein [Chloroflexales bacterium]